MPATTPIMMDDPSVMADPSAFRAVQRQVGEDELTQTHLNNMMDQGGRYLTSARGRGARFAASRGMANSSLAAAGAEGAAIDAAAPIAMSDADAYRAAAGQNAELLAQQRDADAAAAARNAAGENALGARLRLAERESEERRLDREWRTSERAGEQDWRTSERAGEQDWRSGEANLDRQEARRAYRTQTRTAAAAATLGTVLGNPEYFRDPAGAAGAIQFYTDFWDRLFPPMGDEGEP